MKTFYLSQPVYGRTQAELLREREKAEEKLRGAFGDGNQVIWSSVEQDLDCAMGKSAALRLAGTVLKLGTADAAFFCPGWDGARGCRIEHEICKACGIETTEWRVL